MKVVFRVDASSAVGAGHVMRCLALAMALRARGVTIHFICRADPGNLIELIQRQGIAVTALPELEGTSMDQEGDALQTLRVLGSGHVDWLIVDHYGLGKTWEQALRLNRMKLMVIDDLANRAHECDFLLDQNLIEGAETRYIGWVPKDCRLLLGPDYALLRPEFVSARAVTRPREGKLRRILVFFTGGDDQGETLTALDGIGQYGSYGGEIEVTVVVGRGNLQQNQVAAVCARKGWAYHCQVDQMQTLIADADIVIGSGGSSNWERCALGAPALVTVLADNQEPIVKALAAYGAVSDLGWHHETTPEIYAERLSDLTQDELRSMSNRAWGLVDALGAQRVADIIL